MNKKKVLIKMISYKCLNHSMNRNHEKRICSSYRIESVSQRICFFIQTTASIESVLSPEIESFNESVFKKVMNHKLIDPVQ